MAGRLTQCLAEQSPLILDGAMGTELQRRGIDTGLPLWSANALMAHPETVLHIHQEYIAAGAHIITANTFRTTRRTFRRANLPDRSRQLTTTAIDLAQRAREAYPDRKLLIAGSIAPLEDCYRPDLVPPESALREEHAQLAERLAEGGVDCILLETMNTAREARLACEAAMRTGLDVMVSFICNEQGNLLSGEPLSAAVRDILPLAPALFSVNCVSPRHIPAALAVLTASTEIPFAVYGNIGLPESDKHGWEFTRDITEDHYASYARDWRRLGASIIGGCCGTTPEYIRSVVRTLQPRR